MDMDLDLVVDQDDGAVQEEQLKEDDPQPKKRRSGASNWQKYNAKRAEQKRLEREREEYVKKSKQNAIPKTRIRGKQTCHPKSTRVVNYGVRRLDDHRDLIPVMVNASTQTGESESEDDVDMNMAEGQHPTVETYMAAIANSNIYLQNGC